MILNNVNIKTDENYYYYAGYSTSYYGYGKRTARARGKKAATPTRAPASSPASEIEPSAEVEEGATAESSPPAQTPRVTYMRPPSADSDDRF